MNATLRALALAALLGLLVAWAAAATLLDRGALLRIVQAQCLPHWRSEHDPAPCLRVSLPDPGLETSGYVVLPDRKGGAHFLLIPTRRLSGIEDPLLLEPGSTNYFAAAWQARSYMEHAVGQPLPRDAVGLAINSRRSRGQDQLHIHIECLGTDLKQALAALDLPDDDQWHRVRVGRFGYQALRIRGEQLESLDPFQRVARDLPDAAADMGAYTLLIAGWKFTGGPGFIALASPTAPGSETLLDASCALARD